MKRMDNGRCWKRGFKSKRQAKTYLNDIKRRGKHIKKSGSGNEKFYTCPKCGMIHISTHANAYKNLVA